MPIAELYTSSETVTTTEWSLTTDTSGPDTDTTDGVFQFFIDLSNLIAGDQYQISVYEKVTSAGSQLLVYRSIVTGVQSEPVWVSPSLILMHGWDVTLKKLTGTDRSISWSIRQVA